MTRRLVVLVTVLACGALFAARSAAIDNDGGFFSHRTGVDSASGVIYVTTRGFTDNNLGSVWALNPNNPDGSPPAQRVKWMYRMTDTSNSSPAIAFDGTIYVGSDDKYVYALNPDPLASGTCTLNAQRMLVPANNQSAPNSVGCERWRFLTTAPVKAGPAVDKQGRVYVGTMKTGDFYAFDGSQGQTADGQCQFNCSEQSCMMNAGVHYPCLWRISLDKPMLRYIPVIANDADPSATRVYVGSFADRGGLYGLGLRPQTGEPYVIWHCDWGSGGQCGWASGGGHEYPIGGELDANGSLYTVRSGAQDQVVRIDFDSITHLPSVRWAWNISDARRQNPTLSPNKLTVYQTTRTSGDLLAIDNNPLHTTTFGQQLWRFQSTRTISWSNAAVHPTYGLVYFGDTNNKFYSIVAATGTQLGEFVSLNGLSGFKSTASFSPGAADTLYIGDDSGLFYALDAGAVGSGPIIWCYDTNPGSPPAPRC